MAKRARPAKRAEAKTAKRTKKAPAGPPAEAGSLLEQAMIGLQRHDYQAATTVLRQLLERFPDERAIADRANVYLELCDRELASRPRGPASIEERLTTATAALNNGDVARAEQLVRTVLAERPENDLALYLLATVAARKGLVDSALQYLSQAVAASPEAGAQARHDPDFASLRGTDLFRELTGPRPAAPKPRRLRGRAGR